MDKKQTHKIEKVKCWEVFRCKKKDCPAFKSEDLRCWLLSGTHCRDEIQGKFLEKMEICIDCKVFKANMDVFTTKKTFRLINKQLKEFRQIVNDREDSLRSTLHDSQKRQAEISALLEASRAVHKYHDFENSAKAIFDICKNLIGATSGYVALLSKDGNENEVLFLDSGGRPCTVDPKLPMPIRGLRAEAYHTNKAVYHNDFSKSKFKRFMPKGHVRLNNVLFAPMTKMGKAVGVLGLANKPEGFTENDARMATAFGELVAIALTNKWAEEALSEERDRAKTYLDIAGVIIVVIDAKQKVSLINKKGCEILGYDEKEIIGKNWVNTFIPKRYREEVKAAFKKLIVGKFKAVEYFENPILTKNKEERIIAWHNTFLRDEDSKIIATLSSGGDITEQKRAQEALQKTHEELEQRVEERTVELKNAINRLKDEEEKLREAELRYRTVADFTYDWEYWESQKGTMLYVSPSCQRIAGYRQEEFIETPRLLQEIILSEDKETWSRHRQEASTELTLKEVQFRINTRDGQIRWIEHACQPVKDKQGNFLGFRASNRDITDRKKVEEALIKSEERLEEAQKIAHVGNWDWDIQTNKLHWSDEIYRIFGLIIQEFGATYEAFLNSVHPDDREFVKKAVNEALYGKPYSIEHRIVLPDGTIRIVHEKGEVTFGENGKPIRMFGTVQDITEQKKIEEELRNSREQLRDLFAHLQSAREHEKTQIARELHDEFGAILTGLKVDLSWLKLKIPEKEEMLRERLEADLDLINSAIKKVQRISSELRPLVLDHLGLNAAMEWQLKEFGNRSGIKWDISIDIEHTNFDIDFSTAVFRIFQESLTNIIRHAEATKINVNLREIDGFLILDIIDNGKGIPEEKLTDHNSFGLMGLKERTQYLGGNLKIKGVINKGTTVTVKIPLKSRE